ncbi:wax ester/triacylglycerol synthase family O-acyltransferase [uncultured Oceanicoccus sp.]|uniref:WS/DGAT/MGAT family O-acyltransferase n=1 Tax=uncultured Oceanicoccus sp. TaxID=1706381 RepID=UPI0030DB15DE
MKKLTAIDKGFLIGESREVPQHVGGLSLFTLPDGVDEHEYLHGLTQNLRTADELLPPFGDRLKIGILGMAGDVSWERDPDLDMDYHVRHSALPAPGRYRELFNLVSRLHSTLLDRKRPLWEVHLIEGLPDRQFALYQKVHHAVADGIRAMHISRSMLSNDPNYIQRGSPLSLTSWNAYKSLLASKKQSGPSNKELRNVADRLKATFDSGRHLYSMVKSVAKVYWGESYDLTLPHMRVPRSSLNTRVDGARRFVAQSWPFARVKAVGKAFDGTFNDAVLAMCAGALRHYMQRHAELPEESLKSMVPLSVRAKGDADAGNAAAAITVDLATNLADPAERFQVIKNSVLAGRALYDGMSPPEIIRYTSLLNGPGMFLEQLGLTKMPPPSNIWISNVPGIQEQLYWNGSRLDGSYPMSIVIHGAAVNITLITNNQNVDFGIIACRRSVPQVQRLIDYMEEALVELEEAAGIATSPKKKTMPVAKTKTKRASRKTAKAKT